MGFFKSMFSFYGFMGRRDYWIAVLWYIFTPSLLFIVCAHLVGWYDLDKFLLVVKPIYDMTKLEIFTFALGVYVIFAFSYGMLAVMAKRMRDISISPFMCLLYFIPPISPFVIFFYGLFPTNVNSYDR